VRGFATPSPVNKIVTDLSKKPGTAAERISHDDRDAGTARMQLDPARIEEIFVEAAAIADAAARAAYLDQVCAGSAPLRERVDALLTAHDSANSFLQLPDESERTTINLPRLSEGPGTKIGRYKLLEEIGEGGFGVVFMAEQEEPVRRRVALKIIKAGMDTRQVVARFEAERQALAMMDHPNIARVFDGGATDTGRPYFVMELVKGIPITAYCDQQKLSTDERLKLFMAVCSAVQHAHQKGIIHRDLKPSNVMVTLHDDKPVPKIIDFGIAKATQARLTEKTLFTEYRQLIGTPAYMSPEQAQMSGLDVDTRSDIYSLGVLLYELLTGTTPFDSKELLRSGYDEMRRIIREVEPPKPSTRLSTMVDSGTIGTRASERSSDAKQLSQQLRGDLDWIVMKCLEKDRARRYETANGLADDIERYLSDQAVEACPPSSVYRLRKFIRRNKVGVLAGVAVVTALAVGFGVSTWLFLRERTARQQAVSAEQNARTAAVKSEQVANFLTDMLEAAGPAVARGRDATLLREILDKTSGRLDKELRGQPEVQGDLWFTLGRVYDDIGDDSRAISLYEKAVHFLRAAPGNHDGKLALAIGYLGFCQSYLGDLDDGEADGHLAVEIARRSGDEKVLANCLYLAGRSMALYGMSDAKGEPYIRESLKLYEKLGDDPIGEADCLRFLAGTYDDSKTDEGEKLARKSLDLYRQHSDPDHPLVAGALFMLAQVQLSGGKLPEAEATFRETRDAYRRIFDDRHDRHARIEGLLVETLLLQKKYDEADRVVHHSDQSSLGPPHPEILGCYYAYWEKWPAASEHVLRAAKSNPFDHDTQFRAAIASLMAGNKDDYRQLCHQFLTRATESGGFHELDMASKASLVLPVDSPDFERACQLAERAAARETDSPWAHLLMALTEYRRDHLEEAVDRSKRAVAAENSPPQCCAAACYIQALAYARLNQTESAGVALSNGDEFSHKTIMGIWSWTDAAIAEHLRGEVSQLMGNSPPQSPGLPKDSGATPAAKP
jgi:serine/threonine protein kinase